MNKMLTFIAVAGLMIFLLGLGCSQNAVLPEPAIHAAEKTSPKAPEKKAVQPPKEPVRELTFRKIYFDFDKSDLREDMRDILAEHARNLKENPQIKLRIEGHCDERGTIEYNLALGERRVNNVKMYLVNYGITPERLETISYGKERPVDTGHNEAAWAKNRRAEFKKL